MPWTGRSPSRGLGGHFPWNTHKVKLIYIDPPYNTGNDEFNYNDSFNHSTWLTFMKNRLEIAKQLLKKDGVLLVHCDLIEDSYTRILIDEVFGKEMYINNIAIRDSHPSGLKLSARDKTIIKTKSVILGYKKSNNIEITPLYQKRDDWDNHFNIFVDIENKNLPKKSLLEYIKENKIVEDDFVLDKGALKHKKFRKFAFDNRNKIFQSTKEIPKEARKKSLAEKNKVIEYAKREYALNGRRLSPLSKSIYDVGFSGYHEEDFGKLLCDFWYDIDFNNSQNEGGISFPSGKKPEFLMARLITMFTNENDIVLDYHLGSGTTAAVGHKINRQYIGIEQLDYGENDSTIRLQNVINKDKSGISKYINWQGGGSFTYLELKKYNQNFIEQIEEAKDSEALLNIWEQMKEKSFLNYNVDIKKQEDHIEEFKQLTVKQQKEHLLELLDKNQLYVNLSSLEDKDFACTDEEKKVTKEFYQIKE
jgi:adenine-specific DNA-methyltransferase